VNTREFIIWIAESPDIETEAGTLEPQEILVSVNGLEYRLKRIWVRGDNKLILQTYKAPV